MAHKVEFEFGVPIPGEILPPERWARTALKKLPDDGPLDWAAVFGRQAHLVLDLGCGNGRFTLASALQRPELNHLGLDVLPAVIRYATRRANQRGLHNVRFAVRGAFAFLERLVTPHSVAEIHLYHPQPYHQREQSARRLITPEFLALVFRSLVPDGLFVVQTDNPAYWSYMRTTVPAFFAFTERREPWPDAPEGRTRREIVARKQGLPVFRGVGTPRPDLLDQELPALVQQLPRPHFRSKSPSHRTPRGRVRGRRRRS